MRRLLVPLLLAAALTPAAEAATPEAGHVSADRPVQRWSGRLTTTFVSSLPMGRTRCDPPFCDSFTLDVRDAGRLTLRVDSPDSAGWVELEVVDPEGTRTFDGGAGDRTWNELVFEDAVPGTWRLRMWNNATPFPPGRGDYSGRATLVVPE